MRFGSDSLRTRKTEDFEKMAAYATKLTSEWSLKELGCDLTSEEATSLNLPERFTVMADKVSWSDNPTSDSLITKRIPTGDIITKISKHFPEMELVLCGYEDGKTVNECRIKNGERIEIESYSLGIYVENNEGFSRLVEMLQKKELQSRHLIKTVNVEGQCSAILYFEGLSQDEQVSVPNGIIDEITELLPQADFYCFLIREYDQGSWFKRKAHVRNGQAEWQDVTNEEHESVYNKYYVDDVFVGVITADVIKAFFLE
jgi:hypothetical protein